MRKLIILGLVLVGAISCKEAEIRYTQDSPEINEVKGLVADYVAGNWDTFQARYSDTAKLYHNTWDEPISPGQRLGDTQALLSNFNDYSFVEDRSEYEMVITDKGETWVNFWGVWKGTMIANAKEIIIPVHITARFVDGKIVSEYGYWDNSQMMMAMQELAQQAQSEPEEPE
ncbi:nuclear transport factor 2 family protein [Aureitalea marina]|uniref:SnoaL-like domain-containing protein n=1 Tax=Aureitalea marina TaxID=930804 RepID=A0A2S7KQL3_9FLAO|nr:nuclear transport factor 2 family protein [Aureitalea marina]PQB04900.1 hypothetical protein BST85_08365 [Aureitalea marina]